MIAPANRASLALASSAILVALASPASANETLSLDEVLELASDRPLARAADDGAAALSALADAERRAALFPSIQVNAAADRRSEALTLATPMGTLEVADKQRLFAQVAARQPILEASRLFYAAPAARLDADAARLDASRARELFAAEAAARYFDVLEADARIKSLRSLVTSIEARLAELTSLVAEGRAIERDRLRLRLALDEAKLALDAMTRDRRSMTLALGHAVGLDRAVEPAPLEASSFGPAPAPRRADLAALSTRGEALAKKQSAVTAELIPSVALQASWLYDDSLFADQDNFFTVTLNLSWTPLAGGTRAARRRALASEASAVSHRHVELAREIRLEEQRAESAMETAKQSKEVATRGVADASEAQRVTLERYKAGRETVGELLEVEELLAGREASLAVAIVNLERAAVALRLARGTLRPTR